ncbi:MAG: T9SS type A sorting domain-containing protein [Fluviicola sp.]|jgi:photosystem II stability/assembly factor-like uncharacterized protein
MKKIITSIFTALMCCSASAQWTQVNNGLGDLTYSVRSIVGHNGKMYTGNISEYKVYTSADYGNNWTDITSPEISSVPTASYSRNGRLFFGLNVSWDDIFYTDDDAATWHAAVGGPMTTEVRGFHSNANSIFCYTSSKGIYRSDDNGTNWMQINNGLSNLNVFKMLEINNRIFACTIGAGLFVSVDNGSTWVQSNNGINSAHFAGNQLFQIGNTLHYQDQSASRYFSNDDGATWSAFVAPAFWGARTGIFYKNQTSGNIYMKNVFGIWPQTDSIFVSSDNGASWTNITDNLPQVYNESEITEYNGYAFYAFDANAPGQGVFRYGSYNSLIENNLDVTIYPNPVSEKLIIESGEELEEYKVLNQLGQTVMEGQFSMVDQNEINMEVLTNGYYIIQLMNKSKSVTTKTIFKN